MDKATVVLGSVRAEAMKETIERTHNELPSALIEMLIQERNKGKSLRQLGQMVGTSHEAVRQLLAKYDWSSESLLPETRVAAKFGYPQAWLVQLRKEGLMSPISRGWLVALL